MPKQPIPQRCFTLTLERAEKIRRAIWASHGWAQVGSQFTKEKEEDLRAFWSTLPGDLGINDAVSFGSPVARLHGQLL
ncbi:hypothetical protein QEG98_23685 [Myxococcus sp. MxC21-1]|uniref:hypothetical protein n=1 Tax=Myxococcus sp. MxC21-1 TaxID=3041439 RepID=UPI0029302D3E|nr:hypothetical protein [Myxococcus sp. MxC21-1]WNZ59102.1 hypothetical protein QEG98_23685 [Myxococcus sp. MxC21-1]